ncbi:MAG: hypothetical protein WCG27_11770, partial [Pseudomonadota bacterium]
QNQYPKNIDRMAIQNEKVKILSATQEKEIAEIQRVQKVLLAFIDGKGVMNTGQALVWHRAKMKHDANFRILGVEPTWDFNILHDALQKKRELFHKSLKTPSDYLFIESVEQAAQELNMEMNQTLQSIYQDASDPVAKLMQLELIRRSWFGGINSQMKSVIPGDYLNSSVLEGLNIQREFIPVYDDLGNKVIEISVPRPVKSAAPKKSTWGDMKPIDVDEKGEVIL